DGILLLSAWWSDRWRDARRPERKRGGVSSLRWCQAIAPHAPSHPRPCPRWWLRRAVAPAIVERRRSHGPGATGCDAPPDMLRWGLPGGARRSRPRRRRDRRRRG